MSLRSASIALGASLASLSIPALADFVSVSPDHLDFPSTVLTTSAVQTVVLTNPTKKVLNMFSITATGDFSSPGNTCGSTVPPDGQCTINIQFAPTAVGTRTGVLSVNDDANTTERLLPHLNSQALFGGAAPLGRSRPPGRLWGLPENNGKKAGQGSPHHGSTVRQWEN